MELAHVSSQAPSLLSILLFGCAPSATPKAPRRGRPPKQQVTQERGGWGATVAPNVRYIYTSRTTARSARVEHQVGQNGRIA